MDLVNWFLNLAAPPFTFFSLLFFLPPWLFFKFCLGVLSSLFLTEDVSGKVVLITGASSGIGEYLAYEYASRGACLVLAARREDRLRQVAQACREIGSPDVITVCADVSNVHDCRRLVDQTLHRYGRLDHLVNNAGINQVCMLEEADDITKLRPVMDINFWGAVYMTHFAAPHLRNTRGRIIVLSSSTSWLPIPRMSIYNASKAAIAQFFETLRVEFGSDVKITLVTPGLIESEITQGKFLSDKGEMVVDYDIRDVQVNIMPVQRVEDCAREIVRRALRGERYVTTPKWMRMTYFWKTLWPEVIEWQGRLLYMARIGGGSKDSLLGKKVMEFTGAQRILYPESLQTSEAKTE